MAFDIVLVYLLVTLVWLESQDLIERLVILALDRRSVNGLKPEKKTAAAVKKAATFLLFHAKKAYRVANDVPKSRLIY